MKPEICECGHTEEHHKNTYCGVVNCPCKKFEPKNHTEPEDLVSNVGQFDSDTSGSDNHRHPRNPEGKLLVQENTTSGLATNHGSDDELKGNVTDNDKGYSKDDSSLSDKIETDTEGYPDVKWLYVRDVREAVKKLKDDDEDIIEEVLHTEMPSNLSGIEITKWIISKTIELKNKKSDRIF